ncbi:efflux RND transporter periplasmic adaptor subunit [Emticicia sp. CRIBPO]|uniref:efflux RND transporter periplasmic adaptor subunit n=1 Tax=Emticicia sp. CRIBPO TaxID=2683258 RepID=UPI001412CF3B|nr:efflux RND transporter periplasmic adaptor subunit [Emticicia sp. CRIBPO]NBA86693.1 efflux RND transporter periplasmic adaptor subunit [Emticicia sp. CRIBPO]
MKFKALFLTLIIFAVSCGKKEKPAEAAKEESLLTVSLANPERKSIGEKIIGSGVLSSKSELKLAFKTGGMIRKMYVKEGQLVKAGQLLAELDLSEIDAQVQQARLGVQKSERDLDRAKKLFADEATTLTTVQDATTGFEVASQSLQTAIFNQKLSKIYAPATGRILRKLAEQGELITPFNPAIILGTGESAFMLNLGLSDKDLVKVSAGDQAEVSLDAYPEKTFKATVTQIAQTVNPATGTYEVELQMQPSGERLISGFVAKAFISPKTKTSGLMIPIAAVIEANGSNAYVFVYSDASKTVAKRAVTIGKIIDQSVQVFSGISESDLIVTKGANFLSDNTKVNVAK